MSQTAVSGTLQDDRAYEVFSRLLGATFAANIAGHTALFTTSATGLFDAYLAGFSDNIRQEHTCNTCRRFVETFGGLVTIDEHGETRPVMWAEDGIPEAYQASMREIRRRVASATVTGVFLSSDATWGTPKAGGWNHLHVTPPKSFVFSRRTQTAGQAMAEKREDYRILSSALADYPIDVVTQAVTLLRAEALYRAEKVLGVATWLEELLRTRNAAKGRACANIVWRAVALAPAGFCHPRSSMIGTLLDDIAAGLSYDSVKGRFDAKMHPLQYQRPQAAPASGNIAQAEKLFAQLGLAPALERRIARLDEIPKLWEPKPQKPDKPAASGIFGHITPKSAAPTTSIDIPAITMTLEKFVRTVIPTAEVIEVHLGSHMPAIVITTAVDADAPKLFQWDHPFAHYVWHGGATPKQYGLHGGWSKVAGITRLPSRWNDDGGKFTHRGDGLILLLDGARETRDAGSALFPECLRSELHSVRATIEAHSRGAQMQGRSEGSAIGIDLRQGQKASFPTTVRVTAGGRTQSYKLDRWD